MSFFKAHRFQKAKLSMLTGFFLLLPLHVKKKILYKSHTNCNYSMNKYSLNITHSVCAVFFFFLVPFFWWIWGGQGLSLNKVGMII